MGCKEEMFRSRSKKSISRPVPVLIFSAKEFIFSVKGYFSIFAMHLSTIYPIFVDDLDDFIVQLTKTDD